jgi:hypothetical protein
MPVGVPHRRPRASGRCARDAAARRQSRRAREGALGWRIRCLQARTSR